MHENYLYVDYWIDYLKLVGECVVVVLKFMSEKLVDIIIVQYMFCIPKCMHLLNSLHKCIKVMQH